MLKNTEESIKKKLSWIIFPIVETPYFSDVWNHQHQMINWYEIPEHGCLICVMSEQLSSYLKQKYTIFERKNIYHPLKDSQSIHFLCYAFSFKRQNSSEETHRHLKLSYQLIDRLQLEVGNKCYWNRSIMYYFDRTFLDTYEKYM